MSLVRDGVVDLECAGFQAAENSDSHSAGYSHRGPPEEPRLSDLMRVIENLSFKMDHYHERLERCEDFIQGQVARLRKYENFMQQQMTQIEETMTKRPCTSTSMQNMVMSWTVLHAWVIMDYEVNTHGVNCMVQVCLAAMSIRLLGARVPVTSSMA